MGDGLEELVEANADAIAVADAIARDLLGLLSTSTEYPSNVINAVLSTDPETLEDKADGFNTIGNTYRDTLTGSQAETAANVFDSSNGAVATRFKNLWNENFYPHVNEKLIPVCGTHADKADEVAEACRNIRAVCRTQIVELAAGLVELLKDWFDVIAATKSAAAALLSFDLFGALESASEAVDNFVTFVLDAGIVALGLIDGFLSVQDAVEATPDLASQAITEIKYEPASDTADLTGDYEVVEADLDEMHGFGTELRTDAVSIYDLYVRVIEQNCYAEKSLFGGEAAWAKDLHDAWKKAMEWRQNEAWVVAFELQRLGEILTGAAEDLGYSDTEAAEILDGLAEIPDPADYREERVPGAVL